MKVILPPKVTVFELGVIAPFPVLLDPVFCGVGKHSHRRAINLVTCTRWSNLSCAYVSEGADLTSKTVLGIGIFRDLSIATSSEVGSLL